ncbi:MAG TPA: hypothetical protein PLR26_01015 [Bacilli bacterium]|nr:hypothetical protein [Bacilli bacterium]
MKKLLVFLVLLITGFLVTFSQKVDVTITEYVPPIVIPWGK